MAASTLQRGASRPLHHCRRGDSTRAGHCCTRLFIQTMTVHCCERWRHPRNSAGRPCGAVIVTLERTEANIVKMVGCGTTVGRSVPVTTSERIRQALWQRGEKANDRVFSLTISESRPKLSVLVRLSTSGEHEARIQAFHCQCSGTATAQLPRSDHQSPQNTRMATLFTTGTRERTRPTARQQPRRIHTHTATTLSTDKRKTPHNNDNRPQSEDTAWMSHDGLQHYDDVCFFFTKPTLSRFSTVSSV